MRGRRVADPRSPYARRTTPASSSSSAAESPNRLLGLISPASKMITGAAKMISTVFFPDTPPTSSEDDSDDDDIYSQGDVISDQNGARSEANTCAQENLQLNIRKNEVKLAIERLIMEVTFSRAECDKLVKIIESRVVEFPATNVPDLCNSAIMEARKWVQEKKTESFSQFDKNQGDFSSKLFMQSNVTEEEQGSPVLMAKSYMKSRPPWASPIAGHIGFQLTSPTGMHPSKEDTHALSSPKDLKRGSPAIDSGISPDGSKRVRFRAAEDTAQSVSADDNSQRFDGTSVEAEIRDVELGDGIPLSNSVPMSEPVKQSAIGDHDQDFRDAQTTLEGDPMDSSAVITNSKATEGFKLASQSISNGLPQVNGTDELSSQTRGMQVTETESFDDSPSQEDHAKPQEINGSRDLSSASSSSGRENTDSFMRPNKGQEQNMTKSSDGKVEGSCELLSEASVEIPTNEEISNIASGTRNSSSRFSKEKLQAETPSISSPNTRKRSSARIEKLAAKQTGTYGRRGRGRGK